GDRQHEADLLWQLAIQHAELGQQGQAVAQGEAAVALLEQRQHPHAAWFADNLRKYRAGEASTVLATPVVGPRMAAGSEMVVSTWAPQPQPATGPGLLRMAFSAAKSLAKFIGAGLKTVAAETQQQRLRTCAGCAYHTGLRCRICGCFTNVKTRMAHEQCPLS